MDGSPMRVDALIERALEAYGALGDLGEQVADEWQYVNDLVAVLSADLRALVGDAPERSVPVASVVAVETAIGEIELLTDPHRAIDWLSTFPQIVRLAVADPVDVAR